MILLYLIFVFLVLRFTVTLFNFISNPKLTPTVRRYTDFVSILIPVRNEASEVVNLLYSIKKQDYEDFEVLICDDGSTDHTFEICSKFCAEDERFTVFKGKELPAEWQRKNFACHQLAMESRGRYLMFLDPRTTLNAGLINSAVHRMKLRNLSLLSLFADQQMRSFGERLVVPLLHYLSLNLLPLRLVRLSKNTLFAAADGQFMLFDAMNYRSYEWHREVRNKKAEGVEIMRLVKGYGFYGETLLANGFIVSRLYKGFAEAVREFSKTVLAGFGNSVPGLLLYLFLVVIGPVGVFYFLDLELLFFAITLIVLSRIMISFSARENAWFNVVLHPLQMVMLVIVSVLSIQRHLTRSSAWRRRRKL